MEENHVAGIAMRETGKQSRNHAFLGVCELFSCLFVYVSVTTAPLHEMQACVK